jgi:hypothetical protein
MRAACPARQIARDALARPTTFVATGQGAPYRRVEVTVASVLAGKSDSGLLTIQSGSSTGAWPQFDPRALEPIPDALRVNTEEVADSDG